MSLPSEQRYSYSMNYEGNLGILPYYQLGSKIVEDIPTQLVDCNAKYYLSELREH